MIRKLLVLGAALLLTACGGGGHGGSGTATTAATTASTAPSTSQTATGTSSTSATPPPALSNFTTITVDGGPAALQSGPNGYISDNIAFVTVTLCAPGTTNCQTIDHVEVDTGSVGLRIAQSVLNPTLLAALPNETDRAANPVGECYGYVDGYAFGSVRQADFKIGGEAVADMPLQVIGDTGAFSSPPSSCSSGGGTNLNTVQLLGANGVIGIGGMTTDCGTACQGAGGFAAATYYDCPTSGCGSIIGLAASTTAPFQQLPNPVAAMSVDNNGTMISLPAVPSTGETSLTGTLYFGIGTQTNNGLGSATILTATPSTGPNGEGFVTTLYNNSTLNLSFIDTGSNFYAFVDPSITPCTGVLLGYYCPTSPTTINPVIQGLNGVSAPTSITINNAQILSMTNNSVVPGIGANPNLLSNIMDYPTSFDFGLPFFYGRNVFTAIEGRNAGGTVGPYYAFD